jgi:hypothetical protein
MTEPVTVSISAATKIPARAERDRIDASNHAVIECFVRGCIEQARGDHAKAVALACASTRGARLQAMVIAAIGTAILRASAN